MHARRLRSLATTVVVAVVASIAGGVAVAPGADAAIAVSCPSGNLQNAINAAPSGSTLTVSGTCTGNFVFPVKTLKLLGPAILDGGAAGAVLSVPGGAVITLDSITVQNGKAPSGGGGIDNEGGSVTLNSSTVTHNVAGGPFTTSQSESATCSSSPCVTKQESVTAGQVGGGIYNDGGSVTLTSSTVSANTATGNADVNFSMIGSCTADCTLLQDQISAGNAGGGIFNTFGTLKLASSNVSGNSAAATGTVNSSISLNCTAHCTVTQRDIDAGGAGGGIANVNGTVTIAGGSVNGNSATRNASISSAITQTCTVACNAISAFSSGGGGGLFNFNGNQNTGSMTVASGNVSNNTTNSSGGGIFNAGALTVRSSVLTGNTAPNGVGGALANFVGGNAAFNSDSVTNNSAASGGGVDNNLGTFSNRGSAISGNSPDNCNGC